MLSKENLLTVTKIKSLLLPKRNQQLLRLRLLQQRKKKKFYLKIQRDHTKKRKSLLRVY